MSDINEKTQISSQNSYWRQQNDTNTKVAQNKRVNEKEGYLKIPLISKKMNKIEEYINQFDQSKGVSKDKKTDRMKSIEPSTQRNYLYQHRTYEVRNFLDQSGLREIDDRSCVKYDSIADQKSQERIEKLTKLQKDYSLLKQKLQPHRKHLSGQLTVRRNREAQKKQQHISQQDIEKQIKSFKVNQNGKNYFADLYMLKKSRENLINSLSNVGKFAMGTTQGLGLTNQQSNSKFTYEQKLKANQHQFVKGKIMQERQEKKTKMIKGRNLHWNVYYDMLALSANQKKKLKNLCKFTSTFGIV